MFSPKVFGKVLGRGWTRAFTTYGETTAKNFVDDLKTKGTYRIFNYLDRSAGNFPLLKRGKDSVTTWCSNDYLGMGQHPYVIGEMREALRLTGAGSGGTRNISGSNSFHLRLEAQLCDLHKSQDSLVHSSCYIANDSTLYSLSKIFPGIVYVSDQGNHASIISGISRGVRNGGSKLIFKHNDLESLERCLQSIPMGTPKVVVFESIYSMKGSIAPIREICQLATKYDALTFLDEVHAVGLYGKQGGGISDVLEISSQIDIISGTFGKAIGVYGGYVSGKSNIIDAVRSTSPGFIFTTSLPPCITAGAMASIRYLMKYSKRREAHVEMVKITKEALRDNGLPLIETPSHIIPLHVGDAVRCKQISDILLKENKIYVQPINYPTVPYGQEMFRLTPTPFHTKTDLQNLIHSLCQVLK